MTRNSSSVTAIVFSIVVSIVVDIVGYRTIGAMGVLLCSAARVCSISGRLRFWCLGFCQPSPHSNRTGYTIQKRAKHRVWLDLHKMGKTAAQLDTFSYMVTRLVLVSTSQPGLWGYRPSVQPMEFPHIHHPPGHQRAVSEIAVRVLAVPTSIPESPLEAGASIVR